MKYSETAMVFSCVAKFDMVEIGFRLNTCSGYTVVSEEYLDKILQSGISITRISTEKIDIRVGDHHKKGILYKAEFVSIDGVTIPEFYFYVVDAESANELGADFILAASITFAGKEATIDVFDSDLFVKNVLSGYDKLLQRAGKSPRKSALNVLTSNT